MMKVLLSPFCCGLYKTLCAFYFLFLFINDRWSFPARVGSCSTWKISLRTWEFQGRQSCYSTEARSLGQMSGEQIPPFDECWYIDGFLIKLRLRDYYHDPPPQEQLAFAGVFLKPGFMTFLATSRYRLESYVTGSWMASLSVSIRRLPYKACSHSFISSFPWRGPMSVRHT